MVIPQNMHFRLICESKIDPRSGCENGSRASFKSRSVISLGIILVRLKKLNKTKTIKNSKRMTDSPLLKIAGVEKKSLKVVASRGTSGLTSAQSGRLYNLVSQTGLLASETELGRESNVASVSD